MFILKSSSLSLVDDSACAASNAARPSRSARNLRPSAMFVLLILDDLLVQKGKIRLNGLIQQAKELPTPFGKIDIIDGKIVQRLPVEVLYQGS